MRLEDLGKDNTAQDTAEMPTVIFKNKGLEGAVANWFGFRKTAIEGMSEILFELGYEDNESVILDDFDVSEFSFACSTDSNKNMRITLVPSSLEENAVVITKTEGTEEATRTYECIHRLGGNREHLKPYSCEIKNTITSNTFSQTYSQYHWEAEVTNTNDKETYTFYIKVVKPRGTTELGVVTEDNFFELENAEETKKYLLGLTFPISIEEVYKKLCEMSLSSVSEFPNLFISETLKAGNREPKTTNYIWMSDGRINEFVITKNDYTVSIDDTGKWTCESDNTSISQDKKGNISYSIISVPEEAFFKLSPISDRFIVTRLVVESIKRLIKTLFNKNI